MAQGLLGGAQAYVTEGSRLRQGARPARRQETGGAGPLAQARANKTPRTGPTYQPTVPKFRAVACFKNYDLAEIARYIDWGPFFQTWDLAGARTPS